MQEQIYSKVAEIYGTPLYVYSEEAILQKYQSLSSALKDIKHSICFAVKACSNISILSLFHAQGAGFDIVSEGEFRRVLSAGAKGSKVVFSGVAKTAHEIEFALTQQVRMINVESAAELEVIEAVASRIAKKAPIAFRINPDVKVETHPYLATGLQTSKFGIPIAEARELAKSVRSREWLELVGVDCHIGSQISDLAPLEEAYTSVLKLAQEFEKGGAPIRFVDFGGGLGVSYSGHYTPLNLEKYAQLVKRLMGEHSYEVILEPGKYLSVEAGVLLTRVLYTKKNGERRFAIVDAGMNDLLRPSLYEAYHRIDVCGREAVKPEEEIEVDIVGPVCETGCYLARERRMPPIEQGDLLIVRDAGAYGSSMSSNYNSRPLPAEVLVQKDGRSTLIRKRENFEELWRNEILL